MRYDFYLKLTFLRQALYDQRFIKYHASQVHTPIVINSNIVVQSNLLNHPNGSIGYKITCEKKSVVYISDHEHIEEFNQRIIDLLMGTNLIIHI